MGALIAAGALRTYWPMITVGGDPPHSTVREISFHFAAIKEISGPGIALEKTGPPQSGELSHQSVIFFLLHSASRQNLEHVKKQGLCSVFKKSSSEEMLMDVRDRETETSISRLLYTPRPRIKPAT